MYSKIGSNIGEIGCIVKNTRTWVITGFAALAANSRVVIYGQVDMPSGLSADITTKPISIVSYGSYDDSVSKSFGGKIDESLNIVTGFTVYNVESLELDKRDLIDIETKELR